MNFTSSTLKMSFFTEILGDTVSFARARVLHFSEVAKRSVSVRPWSSSRDPCESKLVLMYVLCWGHIRKAGLKHYLGPAGAQHRLGDRAHQTFCKNHCSIKIIMRLRGCIMEDPKVSIYNLPLLAFSIGFAIHPATARPSSSRKRFPSFR